MAPNEQSALHNAFGGMNVSVAAQDVRYPCLLFVPDYQFDASPKQIDAGFVFHAQNVSCEVRGEKFVIRVEEREVASFRAGDSGIESCSRTPIDGSNYRSDSGVGKFVDNARSIIGAAIVDNDIFPMGEGLSLERTERARESGCRIEGWRYD